MQGTIGDPIRQMLDADPGVLAIEYTAQGCAAWPRRYAETTNGDDAVDGLSPDFAWETLAKVNGETFRPTDHILLQGLFREQLTVPSSGIAGKPITIGVYGSGATISGADLVVTWADEGGDVWSATLTTEPSSVFFDGVWGTDAGALIDVDAEDEWFWAANVLYVYSTSDPDTAYTDPGIEATVRNYGIYNNNSADYVTLRNLELVYASVAPVYSDQNDGWVIDGCTVSGGEQYNIFGRGNPAGVGSATGWSVSNCDVGEMYCSTDVQETRCGITLRGMASPVVENNTVATVRSLGINISTGTWDGTGAASTSPLVQSNSVTNCEAGILLKKSTDAIIRYNRVYDSKGFGIAFNTGSNDAQAYYNLIHNLAVSTDGLIFNGFDINIGCDDGQLFNNTVYGVHNSCAILEGTTPSDGWVIRNNIFDSTINTRQGGVSSSIRVAEEVTDYTYSNNLYYWDLMLAETEFDWRQSWAQWQTFLSGIANGSDVDSVADDNPLFTNIGADDFTLQAGSPCRDAGVDVSLTRDYDGVSVPQETNPTIGAYEYVA